MYCEDCGKEISDSAKFCPYCGSKVLEEPKQDSQTAYNSSNTQKRQSKDKKKKSAAPIAVFFAIAMIAGVFFVVKAFWGNGGSNDNVGSMAIGIETGTESGETGSLETGAEEKNTAKESSVYGTWYDSMTHENVTLAKDGTYRTENAGEGKPQPFIGHYDLNEKEHTIAHDSSVYTYEADSNTLRLINKDWDSPIEYERKKGAIETAWPSEDPGSIVGAYAFENSADADVILNDNNTYKYWENIGRYELDGNKLRLISAEHKIETEYIVEKTQDGLLLFKKAWALEEWHSTEYQRLSMIPSGAVSEISSYIADAEKIPASARVTRVTELTRKSGIEYASQNGYDAMGYQVTFAGKDDAGNIIWKYQTEVCPTTELECADLLGLHGERVYLTDNAVLVCLDANTGKELWRGGSFGSPSCAFDPNGSIYICGYYGDSLYKYDKDGRFCFSSSLNNGGWPSSVTLTGNDVKVVFSHPDGISDITYDKDSGRVINIEGRPVY